MSYTKLPDKEYDKCKGQLRLQLNDVMGVFQMYGMQAYIPDAIEEILELAERFGERVRGKDTPIKLKKRRNSRR